MTTVDDCDVRLIVLTNYAQSASFQARSKIWRLVGRFVCAWPFGPCIAFGRFDFFPNPSLCCCFGFYLLCTYSRITLTFKSSVFNKHENLVYQICLLQQQSRIDVIIGQNCLQCTDG